MANNWAPGERTDVWVARHCGRRPAAFYGFDVDAAAMTDREVDALSSVRPPPLFPAAIGPRCCLACQGARHEMPWNPYTQSKLIHSAKTC